MVSFNNFLRLDPSARNAAIELLANGGNHQPPFTSFIYSWMAFNCWMSAVTLEDKDWRMINAVVNTPRLIESHNELRDGDAAYQQVIEDFAALWPVFNVRDVRAKLGYDAFLRHNREALLATGVKRQPQVWARGTAPSWDQLVRSIYQVHCNLFHGEKSPQNARDHDLVRASDSIPRTFIGKTGCFDWHDL